MFVSSYLEIHTTLIAWMLFGVVYELLLATGLLLLPLLWGLVHRSTQSVGQERADSHETSTDHIKSTLMALLVLVFCLTPVWPVTPTDLVFQPPARADGAVPPTVRSDIDPTTYRDHFGPATAPVRIPTWWLLLTHLSNGVTRAVIDSLPSHGDLREASLLLASRNIGDPALGSEAEAFVLGCFYPAKRNYEALRQENLIPAAGDDAALDWPGSPYLLTMPGGYADCGGVPRLCQGAPMPLDIQQSVTLANRVGGLTCADWWGDLRTRLVAHARADQDTWNRLTETLARAFGVQSAREQEDLLVRNLLQNTRVRDGGTVAGTPIQPNHVLDDLTQAVGTVGLTGVVLIAEVTLGILKQALPILAAMMLLFLILFLPFALVFSAYRIGAVLRLSFWIFSLIFLQALLAIAAWLDHALIVSLFEHEGVWGFMGRGDTVLGDAQKKMLIHLVLVLNYTVVPMLWFTVMSSVASGVAQGANHMFHGPMGAFNAAGRTSGNALQGEVLKAAGRAISRGSGIKATSRGKAYRY